MAIKWRDELTIDRGPIDQDHHTLIAIINRFEAVEPGPDAAARLGDVIDSLERYGATHFGREESLQRLAEFPLADAHSGQHRHLLRSLNEARAELAKAGSASDLAVFHDPKSGS